MAANQRELKCSQPSTLRAGSLSAIAGVSSAGDGNCGHHRGWAWYSLGTGIVFLAAWLAVASGATGAAFTLALSLAIVLAWTWITALLCDEPTGNLDSENAWLC